MNSARQSVAPLPQPPQLKTMTMDRLRRQVFTVGSWARKHHHQIVEQWANNSVDFMAEHMTEVAKKISRLRADVASAEADKAALRAELTLARQSSGQAELDLQDVDI